MNPVIEKCKSITLNGILRKLLFTSFILFLFNCRTIDVHREIGQNESVFIDFKEKVILTRNTILPESHEDINKKLSILLIIPSKDNKVKYNDYNFQSEISKIFMWSRKFKKIILTTSELDYSDDIDYKFYLSVYTERKKYIDRYRLIQKSELFEDVFMNIGIEVNKIKRNNKRTSAIGLFCVGCIEKEREALKEIYRNIGTELLFSEFNLAK